MREIFVPIVRVDPQPGPGPQAILKVGHLQPGQQQELLSKLQQGLRTSGSSVAASQHGQDIHLSSKYINLESPFDQAFQETGMALGASARNGSSQVKPGPYTPPEAPRDLLLLQVDLDAP